MHLAPMENRRTLRHTKTGVKKSRERLACGLGPREEEEEARRKRRVQACDRLWVLPESPAQG